MRSGRKDTRAVRTGETLLLQKNWKAISEDFLKGPVVKNPFANAGGHRFDPQARKISHATGQLSPGVPQLLLSPHSRPLSNC